MVLPNIQSELFLHAVRLRGDDPDVPQRERGVQPPAAVVDGRGADVHVLRGVLRSTRQGRRGVLHGQDGRFYRGECLRFFFTTN